MMSTIPCLFDVWIQQRPHFFADKAADVVSWLHDWELTRKNHVGDIIMDVELENLMNLMLYEEGEAIPVEEFPPLSTLIVTYL